MDAGKAGVIGAAITAVGAIIAAALGLIHFGPEKDPALRYPVAVLDSADNGAIAEADVSLNIPDLPSERTDSGGKHTFQLTKVIRGKAAELTVTKDGYRSYREQILSLQPLDEFHKVYLVRSINATAPPPTAQPAASQVTRVYASGQKLSGSGKSFSDWYSVCSTEELGYHVESSSFKLSGDRTCNAWSECAPAVQTATQVCWKFRMQGHDEWPPPGQASSEGILTVVWAR